MSAKSQEIWVCGMSSKEASAGLVTSLRVTSQLIDANTGAHVWAERYERATTDVFAVQDEITESVVASIEPELYAAENRRFQNKPPDSLDAWGHVMRAMPHIWTWGEEESEKALADLRRAIAIEPNYARAHSLLAWTYITGSHMGWVAFADVFGLALDSARRSVERDGEDPWAHLALGYVHMLSRRFTWRVLAQVTVDTGAARTGKANLSVEYTFMTGLVPEAEVWTRRPPEF